MVEVLPRHKLTQADVVKGAAHSKASRGLMARLKLKELKKLGQHDIFQLAATALAQPVISGSLCYFAVCAIESMTKQVSATTTTTTTTTEQAVKTELPPVWGGSWGDVPDWLKYLLPGGGTYALVQAGVITAEQVEQVEKAYAGLLRTGEFALLKGVILIYIATGGNLTGILQSNKDVIMGMLTKVGLAGAVGGAAP